jgi:hypothetical protein
VERLPDALERVVADRKDRQVWIAATSPGVIVDRQVTAS